jgi:hypothetical protein
MTGEILAFIQLFARRLGSDAFGNFRFVSFWSPGNSMIIRQKVLLGANEPYLLAKI